MIWPASGRRCCGFVPPTRIASKPVKGKLRWQTFSEAGRDSWSTTSCLGLKPDSTEHSIAPFPSIGTYVQLGRACTKIRCQANEKQARSVC